MATRFIVNHETGYKHILHDKTVYAIRCTIPTIEKLLNKLYNKYNSVTVHQQKTIILLEKTYYEIVCK